ncbi:hypothetical protein B0T11DRAFT_334912 [Plectosphaerella cucumerina]|uniref:2EXR domain-containing protein n=1 Tax=Plectosphaerella cucumerina TaxID=40658 RepID=A0A8K0TSF0_9PEZI|nr:hypothetical protein B0T11DRAFT_334912 [Plectosphaerella cucumerina]
MLQPSFPLGDLPPELQDEIWTLTLRTTPKIFHIASSSPSPITASFHRLTFHHSHQDATPPAVFICRQSRAAARRAGFVPFPQPDGAEPVWLHAGRDIVFLDTRICGLLLARSPEAPSLSLVPALRAVRHVGIEQGIRMPNTPRAVEAYEGAVVHDFIASLMGEVLKAAPRIEVLHYLAPIVGSWDDRPVNVLDCVITPLDPEYASNSSRVSKLSTFPRDRQH